MSNSNTQTDQSKQLAKEYRELLRLRAKVEKLSAEHAARHKAHAPETDRVRGTRKRRRKPAR